MLRIYLGQCIYLKTIISARLQPNSNLKDVVSVLHPTPAVCGYPKEDAKKFLAFIAQPDIQGEWNKTLGQLPPNSDASINTDDKFIVEGFETVSTAAGLAQFFDRDAPAAMAKAGMEGFQKFMLDPSKVDEILADLDKVQAEVYK